MQSGKIQKVFSTPHLLCFEVRFIGVTKFIYLGRGKGYEGFWVFDKRPLLAHRIQDRFLEFNRKYLKNSIITKVSIDERDRILYLQYTNSGKKRVFAIFYKGRDSYFLNATISEMSLELFISWGKPYKKLIGDDLLKTVACVFDDIGRKQELMIINFEKIQEKNLTEYFSRDFIENKEKKYTSNRKKFLTRKKINIEQDLTQVQEALGLKQKLLDNKLDLSVNEIKIGKKKLSFIGYQTIYQKRDLLFQKIKSFERGQKILKQRFREVKDDILRLSFSDDSKINYSLRDLIVSPIWMNEGSDKKKSKVTSNKKLTSFSCGKIKIFVGKNAQENDSLRNEIASKEDYWFHAEGVKSSHVILKNCDIFNLSEDVFKMVGSIIRDYSGLDSIQILLIYTKVKNLKGLKKSPGSVLFKKEKRITVQYDQNWKSKCKSL